MSVSFPSSKSFKNSRKLRYFRDEDLSKMEVLSKRFPRIGETIIREKKILEAKLVSETAIPIEKEGNLKRSLKKGGKKDQIFKIPMQVHHN
jgi:hypothetical protein